MIRFSIFLKNRMITHRYAMLLCVLHEVGNCFILNSPALRLRNSPTRRFTTTAQNSGINEIIDKKAAKKIMIRLNEDILKHDYLYHTACEPAISDAEYDNLVGLAENIAEKFPDLRSVCTKFSRVGSVPTINTKTLPYVHSRPMLSLENSFTGEGVHKFISSVMNHCKKHHPTLDDIQFVVEPKIDGLSLSVKYVNGTLHRAGTRGDGQSGEDVTANARYLLDLPHSITWESLQSSLSTPPYAAEGVMPDIEVRGEVYIDSADFASLDKNIIPSASSSNDSSGSSSLDSIRPGVVQRFSNARNAAAGTLRAHDSGLVTERKLRFIAYDILVGSGNELSPTTPPSPTAASASIISENGDVNHESEEIWPAGVNSQSEALLLLHSLGFKTPTQATFDIPVAHESSNTDYCAVLLEKAVGKLLEYCSDMETRRWLIGFDTDGTVIKVNDASVQTSIGVRQRSPKWALALKYSPKEAITKLLGITVQVGRTGALTPVAELSPVTIGGVRVERATLHNENEVARLRLRPGCFVRVQRAGDVIPKVVGREETVRNTHQHASVDSSLFADSEDGEAETNFSMPSYCPVCGSPVVTAVSHPSRKGADSLVSTHRCSGGYTCKAQVVERLRHFCSRKAADIRGIGAAVAERLHAKGWVRHPADIYTLRQKITEGPREKGWGEQSVRNLLAAIDASRDISCYKLLYGLGIANCGEKTAKDISKAFNDDFRSLWEYLKQQADLQVVASDNASSPAKGTDESSTTDPIPVFGAKLLEINGVGPTVVEKLLAYASDGSQGERRDVERLVEQLRMSSPPTNLPNSPSGQEMPRQTHGTGALRGKQMVFSGHMACMSRTQAEKLCEELGGSFSNRITKRTNVLIVPNTNSSGDDDKESSKTSTAKAKGIEIWSEDMWLDLVNGELGAGWKNVFQYSNKSHIGT